MTRSEGHPPQPGAAEPGDLVPTLTGGPGGEPSGSIGPYRLLEKLGTGGMGEVWLAAQEEPVRRRVALKIIRLGMESKVVLARFEAERQALALMDHPAIAKIYDAGTTSDGRPYFVMEYVQGVAITTHCDRQRLTTRERLRLFLLVCEGVQHAHQKAVIHRDLKPSNVIVGVQDGRSTPKIIDFGVAKALTQPLTERTLHTELGVMVGTPEYMSPEQAEMTGRDVDTRSDVYSLGVMLYELLVGALPFDPKGLRQAGIDEIRRRIREVDPPRPSIRLSTLGDATTESARRRRTEPNALRRELLGDLDWITMRALEKDRARRYGSPSELAEDIGRHLADQPVLARAPSTAYRAWKFVRRHRVGVAATAVMIIGLLVGTVGSTLGWVRARRAEAQALQEARAKGQVADFLKNLFNVSDPEQNQGNSITARELLDKATGTIDAQLSDQPGIRAELTAIMGEVYNNLGLYAPAESLSAKALDIRRRVLGPEDPNTLASMGYLASVYQHQGRYPEAERLDREALEIANRVFGPEHPDTLRSKSNLAGVQSFQGRTAESERLYREVVETEKRVLGPDNLETLVSMYNLGVVYDAQGRYAEAERLDREVLESQKRLLGPEHPETLESMSQLGKVLEHQGRYPEAERILQAGLEVESRVFGPEHPRTLSIAEDLALAYQRQGRYAEAERLDREGIAIKTRAFGPEHRDTLTSMNDLALVLASQGRLSEAEKLHQKVLEIRRRALGPDNPNTLDSIYNLGCVAALQGHHQDALRYLRDAVEHGFAGVDYFKEDSDLTSLHGDPEFEKIIVAAQKNRDGQTAGR